MLEVERQAINPYLPLNEYVPDGEPHVFGDRIYIFGSHDKENGETFCMLDYVGWSAPVDDLSNWECAGVIYSAKQDPLYDKEKMPHMYAPDVVQGKDGKFYLYYCMSGYAGVGGYSNPISIAVCDKPNGKYNYYGVVQNPDGTPLMQYVCFDPAVMNEDGIIRLYYGTWNPMDERRNLFSNHMINIAEGRMYGRTIEEVKAAWKEREGLMGPIHVTLSDDMKTISTEPRRILPVCVKGTTFEKHPFFEGSSIRKIGDTYYFVYSSTLNHELCYATSKYPDRDYEFRGTIVSNGDIGYQGRKPEDRLNHTGTNHGGIECVNGQWYVFYHRLTHHSDYSRQGCAEKITIQSDGTIQMVEITSCGLNVGPLVADGTYPAPICCNLTNGKMRHGGNQKKAYDAPAVTSKNGERYITNISNGTWIGYKYFELPDTLKLIMKVRGNATGNIEIATNMNGKTVGIIHLKNKLGANAGIKRNCGFHEKWTEVSCNLNLAEGIYPLYFHYVGEGKWDLLEFTMTI